MTEGSMQQGKHHIIYPSAADVQIEVDQRVC